MNAGVILTIVELENGTPTVLTYELLGLGRELADATDGSVAAVCLGKDLPAEVGPALIAHGADTVRLIDGPLFEPYQADAWLPDLAAVVAALTPVTILIGDTVIGAELAPRLAFRTATAVATGCVAVAADAGAFRFARPCYGGNAREQLSIGTAPAIATIKPKARAPSVPDAARSGEVIAQQPVLSEADIRTRIVDRTTEAGAAIRLETADVVVAGGRGLGGPDGFAVATELAGLLGGAVGASRVACDLGWCPPSWQIGLSGRTVAPEVYIALGISGAGQHMAGCGNAKTIIAVNTDAEAPIFKRARFGVIGDCREFLPLLVEEVRRQRQQTPGVGRV